MKPRVKESIGDWQRSALEPLHHEHHGTREEACPIPTGHSLMSGSQQTTLPKCKHTSIMFYERPITICIWGHSIDITFHRKVLKN
jgi:hypothetical protein